MTTSTILVLERRNAIATDYRNSANRDTAMTLSPNAPYR
jgi:hypothetical protein